MDRGAWRATVLGGHKAPDTTEQLSTARHCDIHLLFISLWTDGFLFQSGILIISIHILTQIQQIKAPSGQLLCHFYQFHLFFEYFLIVQHKMFQAYCILFLPHPLNQPFLQGTLEKLRNLDSFNEGWYLELRSGSQACFFYWVSFFLDLLRRQSWKMLVCVYTCTRAHTHTYISFLFLNLTVHVKSYKFTLVISIQSNRLLPCFSLFCICNSLLQQ